MADTIESSAQSDSNLEITWQQWIERRNPMAQASFVCGLGSLISPGILFLLSVAGIVLGVMALRKIGQPRPESEVVDERLISFGHRLAMTGIIFSSISLGMALVIDTRMVH